MTIRPIIFSDAMVRALLEGRKTQTRRLATSYLRKCEPGDRLYVRECFGDATSDDGPVLVYRADHHRLYLMHHDTFLCEDGSLNYDDERLEKFDFSPDAGELERGVDGKWRPSIFMPRWASRLTLRVTDVRFEGVRDIDGIDALAEGITREPGRAPWRVFCDLWDSLHDKPGERFLDNPQVVALTFEVIRGNVDRPFEDWG